MILTLPIVREAARKVVAARGEDFVYNPGAQLGVKVPDCLYVPTTHPVIQAEIEAGNVQADDLAEGAHTHSCLVGAIIEDLGLMTDEIAASQVGIEALIQEGLIQIANPRVFGYLGRLQETQDAGGTAGGALASAERLVAGEPL